jgi:hypothetical protein
MHPSGLTVEVAGILRIDVPMQVGTATNRKTPASENVPT